MRWICTVLLVAACARENGDDQGRDLAAGGGQQSGDGGADLAVRDGAGDLAAASGGDLAATGSDLGATGSDLYIHCD
jgi:hypothetical protein